MKVIYYTFTPFLDCAIELINVLKKHVELHVIIEISPENKTSNIIDVSELPEGETFVSPSKLLNKENYSILEPYLAGTASATFLVYTHKRSFSLATLKESFKVGQYIKDLKADVIPFEGFSLRSMGMIPYLRSLKRIFFTVHDPLPHTGESNWRLALAKFMYFRIATGFFFYSEFARNQLAGHYKSVKEPKKVLRLYPYKFYRSICQLSDTDKEYILFFGRISPYKGIDVLLKAMPELLEKYPKEKLVIAGKTVHGYEMDKEVLASYKDHIQVIDKHLSNQELVSLINNAKLVVCPYTDATQSGVLMTAFAFNTPVIATEVGAFPEYIEDNVNGKLFPVNDYHALAAKLQESIGGDSYKLLRNNLKVWSQQESWEANSGTLLQAYEGSKAISIHQEHVFS